MNLVKRCYFITTKRLILMNMREMDINCDCKHLRKIPEW